MFWNSNVLGAASIAVNSIDHEDGWALAFQQLRFEPSHEDYEER